MSMVMTHHYSQRKVGSKSSFGLFEDGKLVGCCVFSIPASYTLCKGICGKDHSPYVWELSRLVITTKRKNAASFFVSSCLRHIGNHVIVSYADPNDHVGHVGYVYQATNWIYTGNGTAEPKWLHPTTKEVVSFTRRHIDLKAKALGLDWQDLIKGNQLGKHRYVMFTGDRKFRRLARKALRYTVFDYPKGPTKRHIISNSDYPLFSLPES